MSGSDTFCIVPFIHSVVYTNEDLGYCCTADHRRIRSGPARIDKEFVSNETDSIRHMLVSGKKPRQCSACFNAEASGVADSFSKRQFVNEKYRDITRVVRGYDLDFDEYIKNPKVISLDLKFGNKCNLSCRMCTPGSSSKVAETAKKVNRLLKTKYKNHNTSARDYYILAEKEDTLTFDSYTINNIKSLMPQLQEIQTAGGETFINDQYTEILQYAVDNGYNENIALEVTTNGTKFIEEKLDLITQFRYIDLIISIDGVEKIYEYIRYPFKFNLIVKRLNYLKSYISRHNLQHKVNFSFACLGQIYNVFDYFKLYNILLNIFDNPTGINLNLDMDVKAVDEAASNKEKQIHPLHCSNLPINILQEALDEYNDLAGKDFSGWWLTQFAGFVSNYKPNDPNKWKTKNYTLMLDRIYKQDYHNYLDPRIVKFLDNLKGDI